MHFLYWDSAQEGDNYGLPKRKRGASERTYWVDKNGKYIPFNVRRYPYADEYTYRI